MGTYWRSASQGSAPLSNTIPSRTNLGVQRSGHFGLLMLSGIGVRYGNRHGRISFTRLLSETFAIVLGGYSVSGFLSHRLTASQMTGSAWNQVSLLGNAGVGIYLGPNAKTKKYNSRTKSQKRVMIGALSEGGPGKRAALESISRRSLPGRHPDE